jgi:alpha-L-rhamnosidase
VRGKIVTDWRREGEHFILRLTIPANCTATVCLPSRNRSTVTESGDKLSRSPGVTFLRQEGNRSVFAVASGNYEFKSSW